MLFFIGIGLGGIGGISLDALATLSRCDVIFAEGYTGAVGSRVFDGIGKVVGKKVVMLGRRDVEEGKRILGEAKKKTVALLCQGDPMVATTHISLMLDAEKAGIKTKILHAASIYTAAIGESGLQLYGFGKPTTLTAWSEKYKPTSPYSVIAENLKRGLHSFVFLDVVEGRPMDAKEGLKLLLEMEKAEGKGFIDGKTKILVLSRVGNERQKKVFGEIGRLIKVALGKAPFIFVIPGKLHFMEEEVLMRWGG